MSGRSNKKPDTIKILVCSGNLGNAQPDLDSIDAWIPRDGYCRHVLDSKYPVAASPSNGLGASLLDATPAANTPRLFEQSLNSLLLGAKQSQQDIENGKHHSNKRDSRMSMINHATSCDSLSNMDDLIGILEEEETPQDDASYDAFDATQSLVNNEQFDIIVIGMQESTFDVIMHVNTSNTSNTSFISGDDLKTNPISPKDFNMSTAALSLRSPKELLSPLLAVTKGVTKAATKTAKGSATIVTKAAKKGAKNVSSLTAAKDHTLTNNKGSGNSDTHALHNLLQEQLPTYTQAVSYQRGEMRLIVLYQQDAIDLDVLSVKAQNTGRAGLANKGGIVTEISVNQTTRLAFLTAHLEAHEGQAKYATRCSTIADIFKGTESSVSSLRCDASISSHFMFVTGDLNFRTRLPNTEPGSPEHVKLTHQLAYDNNYAMLGKYDELSHALQRKDCLVGFQTPVCNFPPTFKVERQEGYKYKDNRSPSYTDRILYLGADQLGEKINVLGYEPIDSFSTSDHKPIRGAFEVELNQKLKWRPVLANRCVP
jgi:hypothetical protein